MDHSHSRSRSDSKPPPYSSAPISTSTSTSAQIQSHNRSHSHNQSQRTPAPQQRPLDTAAAAPSRPASRRRRPSSPGVVSAAFLEPRIAVVLKIPKAWRPWLFFSRLLSICPAILWGLRPALQLLLRLLLALPWKTLLEALGADVAAAGFTTDGPPETMCPAGPASLRGVLGTSKVPSTTSTYPWTDMSLGVIWCGSSAYLSFFFADCLMSRWLINYSPQAAIIRLLTINCANAFLTERILFIAGGFDDARLLLPGWVSIATALTLCYHITQRKINIRKETSTSINIFSIASFVSMVALLAHLHTSRLDYPDAPLLHIVRACRQYWAQMVGENDGDLDAKCEL
ncbi:N-glycosylation protein eos1 like [Verticillium longisporum]|nr:N-glycosylation protein eos1 like [Verticillium longisporum]